MTGDARGRPKAVVKTEPGAKMEDKTCRGASSAEEALDSHSAYSTGSQRSTRSKRERTGRPWEEEQYRHCARLEGKAVDRLSVDRVATLVVRGGPLADVPKEELRKLEGEDPELKLVVVGLVEDQRPTLEEVSPCPSGSKGC
ncbi:UNVERIFIED_CONTAM: hypothetical protein FKN15_004584 [Acipenser sinensis]